MKDSGIPWIGEIPSHWDTCFIKQVMRNKSVKGYPDEQVLSLYREYGVVPKDSRDDNHNTTSEDTSGYKLVDEGDFVINKMKAWQGSMAVSGFRGIISPAYYVCLFTAPVYKKYIHYLLRNETYKAEYMRLSTGLRVGQWDLNVEDFLRIPMVLPPIPEQQSIADFLDKKCREIDEMVSLQEKIVEELKAYKQSVITEAVCKGLNPDVPMRNSGIEWIDCIPEHWEEVRFYKVNSIRGRLGWKGLKAEEYTETGYPFLSAFNIVNDKLSWEELNFINQERYDESPEIKLSIGDVLVVKDGAGIGKCARIDTLPFGEATVNSSLAVITPSPRVHYAYQYYYMLSKPFQNIIWLLKIGMGVPHLTQENMHDILETCPPLEEQKAIVDYLDAKCNEIDTLISLKQSKIDALKEYKKSIIYEYITGKKEVEA